MHEAAKLPVFLDLACCNPPSLQLVAAEAQKGLVTSAVFFSQQKVNLKKSEWEKAGRRFLCLVVVVVVRGPRYRVRRGLRTRPDSAAVTVHPMGSCPTAGDPIYKAQKSDFLMRKVADLRQIWRNRRNCAKKLFAQIRRMRRRMRWLHAKNIVKLRRCCA